MVRHWLALGIMVVCSLDWMSQPRPLGQVLALIVLLVSCLVMVAVMAERRP